MFWIKIISHAGIWTQDFPGIKTCMYYPDSFNSFNKIHTMNNRALPDSFMHYKTAIQLYKLYNSNEQSLDWMCLNFNQILTTRQTKFMILKTNKTKVGLNTIANRLSILNSLIPLSWLGDSLNTLKVKIKKLFLTCWEFCFTGLLNLTCIIKNEGNLLPTFVLFQILKFIMCIMYENFEFK